MSDGRGVGDDDLDLLLSDGERAEQRRRRTPPSRRRRLDGWVWVPALSIVVGLLVSGAAVAVAALAPPAETSTGPESSPTRAPAPAPRHTVDPIATPDVASRSRPISDLPDSAWVSDLSSRTGIPERPLRAYAGAAIRVAEESPECGIGWNTLAGIGFVESEHGTIHGSEIGVDGVARPDIIGIALTGESSLAIRDTDGGELDGDTVWDRAVGPMQFISETWSQWGADGDGDGVQDPQNIDDSALAAARYLCFAGGDLTDPSAWIAAVHAYNPSIDYNNRVAEAAEHYAAVTATP